MPANQKRDWTELDPIIHRMRGEHKTWIEIAKTIKVNPNMVRSRGHTIKALGGPLRVSGRQMPDRPSGALPPGSKETWALISSDPFPG